MFHVFSIWKTGTDFAKTSQIQVLKYPIKSSEKSSHKTKLLSEKKWGFKPKVLMRSHSSLTKDYEQNGAGSLHGLEFCVGMIQISDTNLC